MHLLNLIAFLPLVAKGSSLTLPSYAEEGFALHFWDDDGTDLYIHESNFTQHNITFTPAPMESPLPAFLTATATPTVSPTVTPTAGSVRTRGLPNGDSITCLWNTPVVVSQLHDGVINFADTLGCGYTYNVNPQASYKYVALIQWQGSTVIYTCNYSGSPRVWGGPELVGYMEQVFNYCSQSGVASWYYDNFRKISWGWTNRANAYCGPAQ